MKIKNSVPKSGQAPIVRKLKAAMEAHGYSQSLMQRLTAKAGMQVHQTRFSKWAGATTERMSPEYKFLPVVAEVLRVPVAYLADDSRPIEQDMKKLELERSVDDIVRSLGVEAAFDRLTMMSRISGPIDVSGGPGVEAREVARREDEVAGRVKIHKGKKAEKSA